MTKLSELGDSWMNYDVIGIDEGQFYADVSISENLHFDKIIQSTPNY